jgi:hypothetical protein
VKASSLLSDLKGKSYGAYEAAVFDAARTGKLVGWPLVPLTFDRNGHKVTLKVASDYLSVGEPDDLLRTPLFPITAQRICDMLGMMLPTPEIASQIWRQATMRLTPTPMVPNLGPSLQQFADHSAAVDKQKASSGQPWGALSNGQKKDIVVGHLVRPGKVIIFGWFWPDDATIHGPYMTDDLRASNPIQPDSDAHGDTYVDYSHGVRLVCRECEADGTKRDLVELLADPTYAALLSVASSAAPQEAGPVSPSQSRYPAPALPAGQNAVPYVFAAQERRDPADRGLDVIRARKTDG